MAQRRSFQVSNFTRFLERLGRGDGLGCRLTLTPSDPRDTSRGCIHSSGNFALLHIDPFYAYDPANESLEVSLPDPAESVRRTSVFWDLLEAAAAESKRDGSE